jgi:hypothetical protein
MVGWSVVMSRVVFLWIALCLALPAWAQTYHVGSKCKQLTAHVPNQDVNVSTGTDIHGNPVVPADLNASPVDIESLKNPPIGLNLPISAYINPEIYNADLSDTRIQAGTISTDAQSNMKLNNEILSTSQQGVYPEECK